MKIEEWEVVKGQLLFLSSYLINRTYSRACPPKGGSVLQILAFSVSDLFFG